MIQFCDKRIAIGLTVALGFLQAACPLAAIPTHSRLAAAWNGQALRDADTLVPPAIVTTRTQHSGPGRGIDHGIPVRINNQIERAARESLRDATRKLRRIRLRGNIMASMRDSIPGAVRGSPNARSIASPPSDVPEDHKAISGKAAGVSSSHYARPSRLLRDGVHKASGSAQPSAADVGPADTQVNDPMIARPDRPKHRRRHRHLDPNASTEESAGNVSVIDDSSSAADRPGTPPAFDVLTGSNVPKRPPARRFTR